MQKTIARILGGVLILSGLGACTDSPNAYAPVNGAQLAAPIPPPNEAPPPPGQLIAPGSNIGVAPPGPPH